jgi:hypothetical protein
MNEIVATPAVPESSPASVDKLAQSLLGAFDEVSDSGDAVEPAKGAAQPAKKPKKAPEPEPEEDDDEEQDDEAAVAKPARDVEPEEDDDAEPEDTRGSKEEPFSIKDLPADKYVKIKVDGEDMVVSARELADGYTRTEAFNKNFNRVKMQAQQAAEALQRAQAFPKQFNDSFNKFIRDPEHLLEYFMRDESMEQVLETLAIKYAQHSKRARENPEYRLQYQRQRDQAKLAAEREAFETQRRTEMQQRQQQEAQARARAVFDPGWKDGLKRAGFPQLTKETDAKLRSEVILRCQQKANSGQLVTTEDVSEYTMLAAKYLNLPTAKTKPAPSQVTQRQVAPPQRTRVDYSKMSNSQKKRDPNFFLAGVKTRDLLGR